MLMTLKIGLRCVVEVLKQRPKMLKCVDTTSTRIDIDKASRRKIKQYMSKNAKG